jgi:aminoglycoside phosphotransferase (APT) family kinase protein
VGELSDILQRLESSLGPLRGAASALDGGITNRNYRVTLGAHDYVIRLPGKGTELLGIDRAAERAATATAASLGIAPAVAAAFEDCLVTRFVACQPVGARELAASVARIAAVMPLDSPRPCHNDLLAGNLIRAQADGRVMIVDWEYAGMGDPRFDLGNLSVNNDFDAATDERLLRAYYGEAPSDSRRATLQLMRVLSDAREGAWGGVQAHVSEIGFDFERYAEEHFERLLAAVEQPAFAEWLAAAQSTTAEESDSGQAA